MSVLEPFVELARGSSQTFKFMFERTVTIQYPEEKRPVRPRFRGRHVLKRYENGLEKHRLFIVCRSLSCGRDLRGSL